jgi:hypothetical protein
LVNDIHQSYLRRTFFTRSLIDTDGIGPKRPYAIDDPKALQGLEQVPGHADNAFFTDDRFPVRGIAPSVRDRLVTKIAVV